MNILAFGVTGFVGGALVPHLLQAGHRVTVVARSGKTPFGPEVPVLQADPTVPGPWQEHVSRFDAVVNLTGTPVTTRWNTAGRQAIRNSRVDSTRHIAQALGSPGKTLLCAGAVGYYGHGADMVLTEDAPRGQGFLADVAAAWQDEALQAANSGHRVVIPRIAVVLGHGGALAKMLPPFRLGLGGRLGSGRQWFPWIHIRDLTRCMTYLLETPQASGPYNACAPTPVTNAEFTRTLARVLHRPAVLPVPAQALRLILGEQATMLLEGQRCLPTRLQALGFTFDFPELETALNDLT